MSERFERIFTMPSNIYSDGAPLIISAGALLKDTEKGSILAQLKFKNICSKTIKAIKIRLFLMDTVNKPLDEEVCFEYLDFELKRDEEYGQKIPIPIPNPSTRSISAEVIEVAFTDNDVWNSEGDSWSPLPEITQLENSLGSIELAKQFRLRFGKTALYHPVIVNGLWCCTCGSINWDKEKLCHACGCKNEDLFSCNLDELKSETEKRLAKEAEVARQEAEAEKIRAKKRKRIASIAIPALLASIAAVLFIALYLVPTIKYNRAVTMVANGQYDEAISAFESLNGFKDSSVQIQKAKNAQNEAALASFYNDAEQLVANGDYAAAIDAFTSLGSYRDSARKVLETQKTAFEYAESLMKSGKYDEAAAVFDFLGDYRTSSKRKTDAENEARYAKAKEQIDSGNYRSAFLLLDGWVFKDSQQLIEDLKQKPEFLSQVIASAEVGDTIFFGSYEQDNDSSNGKELVEWLVIDRDKSSLFLLSKNGLDNLQFDKNGDNKWETSSLRTWLNSDFINLSFTTEEQERILLSSVPIEDKSNAPTNDKVFLLSVSEYRKFDVPLCIATEYALAQGAPLQNGRTEGACIWWTRTPCKYNSIATVRFDGFVWDDPGSDPIIKRSIRPAIKLSLG